MSSRDDELIEVDQCQFCRIQKNAAANAEEAEELAQKSSDIVAQRTYQEIARLWRDVAKRAEWNKHLAASVVSPALPQCPLMAQSGHNAVRPFLVVARGARALDASRTRPSRG